MIRILLLTFLLFDLTNFSLSQKLKDQGKGAVFVGSSFIYGLLGSPEAFAKLSELESFLHQVAIDSAEEDRQRALKKLSKEQQQEQKAKDAAVVPVPAAGASSSKPKQLVRVKDTVVLKTKEKGKPVTTKVTGLAEIVVFAYEGHTEKVVDWFRKGGFVDGESL